MLSEELAKMNDIVLQFFFKLKLRFDALFAIVISIVCVYLSIINVIKVGLKYKQL